MSPGEMANADSIAMKLTRDWAGGDHQWLSYSPQPGGS